MDPLNDHKRCKICQEDKLLSEFSHREKSRDKLAYHCKSCDYKKNKERSDKYAKINELQGPAPLTEKKCGKCNNIFPIDQFWLDKRKKDGYRSYCKRCFIDTTAPNRARFLEKSIIKVEEDLITHKTCSGCKQSLPLIDFSISKSHVYGLQSRCRYCSADREKSRRDRYKSEGTSSSYSHNMRYKIEVFSHYSQGDPKCACCNTKYLPHLTLDHINQDGAKRRKNGEPQGGAHLWKYVKDNNYPLDFRILCYNCNITFYKLGKCECSSTFS